LRPRHGKVIKRSSLSPQLSRLKSDGILVLRDNTWYLPQHLSAKQVYYGRSDEQLSPTIPQVTQQALRSSTNHELSKATMPGGKMQIQKTMEMLERQQRKFEDEN